MWRTWGRCATCGCARGWPRSPWRATRCACGRGPALPTRCVSGPPAARAPEGEALWGSPRSQRPLCPPEHGPHPGWATGATPGHVCRAQPACTWNLPTIIMPILLYRWGPSGPQPDPTEPPARNTALWGLFRQHTDSRTCAGTPAGPSPSPAGLGVPLVGMHSPMGAHHNLHSRTPQHCPCTPGAHASCPERYGAVRGAM